MSEIRTNYQLADQSANWNAPEHFLPPSNRSIAIIDPILHLSQALDRIGNKTASTAKFVLFYGAPGTGKTTALEYVMRQNNGVYHYICEGTTLSVLANELIEAYTGEYPGVSYNRARRKLIQIVRERNCPLAIDEAGLLSYRCLEFIRNVHDLARVPIVLTGMDDFYYRLKQHRQLLGRMLYLPCRRIGLDDAIAIATTKITTKIERDLLKDCHTTLRGDLRAFCETLDDMEQFASDNGYESLSLAIWGKQSYMSEYHKPPRKTIDKYAA